MALNKKIKKMDQLNTLFKAYIQRTKVTMPQQML